MTRLWTDGAEMGDLLWLDYHDADHSITSTNPGSGIFSYAFFSWTPAYRTVPACSEIYVRTRYRSPGIGPIGTAPGFPLFMSDDNIVAVVGHNEDGFIDAYIGSDIVATGGYQIAGGIWYLFESYLKIADSGGRFIVKQDGVVIIDFTGDTKFSTYANINRIGWRGGHNGGPLGSLWGYFDDLAANSVGGGSENSWCGDGRVELLRPNAEGDTLQWVPSTGTTHYQMVDEFPHTGDADYVYTTQAAKQDMFNLGTFNDTNKIVDRIWVEARAKDNSAGSGQVKVGFKTGSTVYLQSTAVTLPAAYTKVVGDITNINPVTGLAWTKTDLDALQVVIESET